jgi:hypothetical protein
MPGKGVFSICVLPVPRICLTCDPTVKTWAVDRFNKHGAHNEKRLRMSVEWTSFSTLLNEYIFMKEGNAILVTGHGACWVMRRRGSHVFWTLGSQMAMRLSALHAERTLTSRKIPGTHFC